MPQFTVTSIIVIVFFNLNILLPINTQIISMCDTLKHVEGDENNLLLKLRRIRALCDVIQSSRGISDKEDSDLIPDFDLTQIDTENDVNQILKRFRRGRFSSSRGSRFSSRSSSRSSSSSSGGSSRIFSRSSSSSSSSGSGGSETSSASNHRISDSIRSVIRKPTSSSSGISSGSSSLSETSGNKPSFSDRIRSRFGIGGSGGNVWARSGKKFLPYAVRYEKRYYQRRKYNKGMYAGAGYYAGSQMHHHGHYYPSENYDYPPVVDNPPEQINGKTPTVFYCIQEDLNITLVNKTLDNEGFGICNISDKLVACPIEIECKISEADNCCEDEQGTPYCCGGSIPEEYVSQYGGYEDNDATESLNKILNIVTVIGIMISTICFTIWQQRE